MGWFDIAAVLVAWVVLMGAYAAAEWVVALWCRRYRGVRLTTRS